MLEEFVGFEIRRERLIMSDTKPNSKIVVWSLCASLVLWALSAHAAELPPDPNNAALLYYQAFLLCPDLDSIPAEAIETVFGSFNLQSTKVAVSVEEVRKYAKDYKHVIQIAEAASKISRCDWGLPYPPFGGSGVGIKVSRQAKVLAFFICAEARVLAADGDYKAGFARCLLLCRFARHFGQWQGSPLPNLLEASALRCVRQILQTMPADEKTLRWLSEQLAAKPPVTAPLSALTKNEFECMFSRLREGLKFARMRQALAEEEANDKQSSGAVDLMSVEVLDELIRKATSEFLDPALEMLASDIPYVSKYEKIESLAKAFNKQLVPYDPVIIPMVALVEKVATLYNNDVRYRTLENALRSAIEIYLCKATTGRLPDAIPDGLSKDAYSGQDFEYEITDDGFLLRCRGKDLTNGRIESFAFKVQK
jgi:hypothetical protein